MKKNFSIRLQNRFLKHLKCPCIDGTIPLAVSQAVYISRLYDLLEYRFNESNKK